MQISLRHHMPHQDIIIQARNQAVRIFPAALLLHGKNLFVKFCVTLGKWFWKRNRKRITKIGFLLLRSKSVSSPTRLYRKAAYLSRSSLMSQPVACGVPPA